MGDQPLEGSGRRGERSIGSTLSVSFLPLSAPCFLEQVETTSPCFAKSINDSYFHFWFMPRETIANGGAIGYVVVAVAGEMYGSWPTFDVMIPSPADVVSIVVSIGSAAACC
ncbi:hypothetical protein GOP47_0002164 [Adiantum capillus-veneris]|uniref:Uncharacterized protein n=1 Tax=Adiantum capillus-veneris TaxID=13818 RepID=A0A9D4ZQR7_ADICA|nr:hypothetical protein GOP47_0002164 [Adiantum capillus-veneris]